MTVGDEVPAHEFVRAEPGVRGVASALGYRLSGEAQALHRALHTTPAYIFASGHRAGVHLAQSCTWGEHFAGVRSFLQARLDSASEHAPVRPEVAESWRWMMARVGTRRMDELAAHVAMSSRHLSTLFDREVVMSPKGVNRLIRFDGTRR